MDRISQGAATLRGRWRLFATVIPTAAVVALCAGAALAASHASLSLKSKTIVPYATSEALTGRLSSGKKGALVELQQRVWPFKHDFKTVATTHTGANGAYVFERRPSLATQYRALAPKSHAQSHTRTVYVVKSYRVLKCVLRRAGQTYQGCGTTTAPPGKYTWHLTIEFIYPASVFGKEKSKAVYSYFGQRVGSRKTPRTLTRQKTAHQRPYSASTTYFKFTKGIVIPHSKYEYEGNFCTRTTERTDGFGLPGAPGSHMCGKTKIPGKTSVYKLG